MSRVVVDVTYLGKFRYYQCRDGRGIDVSLFWC